MQINGINNNVSIKFNGLLKLHAGIEVNGPGFPQANDAIDLFSYIPFKDDSIEDIESDKIKLQQLDGYTETQKFESDKYKLRKIGAKIKILDAISYTRDEFAKKQLEKTLLNLSDISPEEIVDKVKEMKKNIRKADGSFLKDGSLLFKYM